MGSATVLLAGLQLENNTKNFYLVLKITTTLTVTPGLPLSKERPPRLLSIQIPSLSCPSPLSPPPLGSHAFFSHDILTPGAQQPGPCPALPCICSALVLHWPWTCRPAQFCGLCTRVSLKEEWGQRVWVSQRSLRRSRADFELTGCVGIILKWLVGAYRVACSVLGVRVYVLFHAVILGDRFCYVGER
uniref:Uncharacterized protein n=1 Tax=Gorilla gorilla gorilla TaxID=9595 RepID=A0A2I2YM71_GORGO